MISIYEITVNVAVFIIKIIVNYFMKPFQSCIFQKFNKISSWFSYKGMLTALPKYNEMFATYQGIGFATIAHHYL